MDYLTLPDGFHMHYAVAGPENGPAVVFAHGLGTNLGIWDEVCRALPDGLRIIRYDQRGHGKSDCPAPPYSMGALVRDAESLLDQLQINESAFIGLGLGGLVAQGLAVKRLDLVRALILSGTAAKLGQNSTWKARAETAQTKGMFGLGDDVLSRWFPGRSRTSQAAEIAKELFLSTKPAGYAGGCLAIAGTDFYTPTSGLRLPTLGLAGIDDRATPPDLQRETIELIPGSQFRLLRRAGHQACLDNPRDFAAALEEFLCDIGHC